MAEEEQIKDGKTRNRPLSSKKIAVDFLEDGTYLAIEYGTRWYISNAYNLNVR